jgi:tight adherence protein B
MASVLVGLSVLLLLWPSRRATLADLVRGRPARSARGRTPLPVRSPRHDPLAIALAQAGLSLSPLRFRLLAAAAGLPLGGIALLLGLPLPVIVVSPLASLLAASWLLGHLARRARSRMEAALVAALPPLVSSLQAGMGLEQAIAQLAARAAPPLRDELETLLTQVRLGATVQQALESMASRWPLPAVRTLAVAVSLQREVGGSLAGVLQVAEEGIRARHELLGEVRSLTAQQRLTAYLLLGLPFAVMGALSLFSPDYASRLFASGAGRLILGGAVLLQGVGYLLMRSLMRVDADVG